MYVENVECCHSARASGTLHKLCPCKTK